jgi:hypothetical protein
MHGGHDWLLRRGETANRFVPGTAEGFAFPRRRHGFQHVDVGAHDEAVRLAGHQHRRLDLCVVLQIAQ